MSPAAPASPAQGLLAADPGLLASAPEPRAAPVELAAQAEELLAIQSTQKSLAFSPLHPLQAPRDGCRVGVGVAGGEG